jgi:hypothetical protein
VRRALLALTLALAGCGGSAPGPAPKPPPEGHARGEAVIRTWTKAVYDGDYERAGAQFAPDAIVQQGGSIVLRTRAEAVAFSRSLPCRAKVTGIEREPHGVLLASFDLFPGRGGRCPDGGTARVRFLVRHGKIETWRQLPEAPQAPGQST